MEIVAAFMDRSVGRQQYAQGISWITCKRSSSVLLVLVLILTAAAIAGGQALPTNLAATPSTSSDLPSEAPRNPQFVDYLNSRSVVRSTASGVAQAPAGHQLGLIPTTIDFSYLKQQRKMSLVTATVLPAAYDLRTLGKVSPVKDQGACGICWTFATYGSLESALLPGESLIFSENNMKNLHGFDACPCDPTCSGGNWQMSGAYLTRWSGPISAADDPYQQTNINSSPAGLLPQKHVQDIEFIMGRTGPTDNANLKNAVMAYGGLYVPMYIDVSSGYYNPGTGAFYYTGASTTNTNHAVTLIGWDDNYDANNFATPAPGNGAFLAKNSWGTSFGQQGFFWISYYDTVFANSMSVAFAGADPVTNYSHQYEYDPLGLVSNYGWGDQSSQFANVFTAAATEQIVAVGTYFATDNTAYTINVYTDANSGPTSGTQLTSISGTVATAGYHTIALPSAVPVTAGQKFSVVLQLTTPSYGFPIPGEVAVAGYSSQATASAGQSYISRTGAVWTDSTIVNPTLNVALKAFAVANSITVTSPNGGETWQVGSTRSIAWSAIGVTGDVNINLLRGGVLAQTIATVPAASGSYSWKISAALSPASNYTIRVQSVSDPTVVDDSNAVFSIAVPPSVTVVTPNGGESWQMGTTQNVTWNAASLAGNVTITLLKAGTGYFAVGTAPASQGSFSWKVPTGLAVASDYTMRVVSAIDSTVRDVSDATFLITAAAPSITVLAPNGGESWPMNTTHTITWNASSVVGNVNITLLKAGVGYFAVATGVPASQGSFSWKVPVGLAVGSDYTMRVMSATNNKQIDVSNVPFSITPPPVTVVSPNGGESWAMGTTHLVTWTTSGVVGNVNITLLKAGAGYFSVATGVPAAQGSFSWTIPSGLAVGSDYTMRVMSATDNSQIDVSNTTFSLTAPVGSVTVLSPNGLENWAIGSTQTITWTSSGLTGNVNIALLKAGVGYYSIATGVPVSAGTFSWTVPNGLALGSDYTVRVMSATDGTIKDVSNANFSISTASSLNVVAPNGGESWVLGSTQTIQWNAVGVTKNLNVTLLKAGSGFFAIGTNIPASPGSFSWTIPAGLPAASDYSIRVMTTDGTLIAKSSANFSLTTQ